MARRNGKKEFAVIGLGRFGTSLAMTLMEQGFHVLGIDRDTEIVQRLSDQITQAVSLDSTHEDALSAVDIISFDTVVVADATLQKEAKEFGYDHTAMVKVLTLYKTSPYMALSLATSDEVLWRLQQSYDELVKEKAINFLD